MAAGWGQPWQLHRGMWDGNGPQEELARIARMLADHSGARLVTLVGPSGVGKTWAAREVVRLLPSYDGPGVVWTDLSRVETSEEMFRAVAGALHAPVEGPGIVGRVVRRLSVEPTVLVLDGCDRLTGDAEPVRRLLHAARELRVLATSLAALRMPGEQVLGVDPLPVPSSTAGPAELADNAAVQLFCRRLQEADPGFLPSAADLAAIGQLCRHVHGLPLGIEILARRVRGVPLDDMLALLGSGHRLAEDRPRLDAGDRHTSVYAALDRTYDALSPNAQELMRRMAVFHDPATLDVLRGAMAGGSATSSKASSEAERVTAALTELVDHRLVEVDRGGGGELEPAFRLVPLVHDLAFDRLVADGEQALAEDAHTQAMLVFVTDRCDPVDLLDADGDQRLLERSDRDLAAALRRITGRGDVSDALRLATAIAPYAVRRGRDDDLSTTLGALLRRAEDADVDPTLRARGWFWRARLIAGIEGPTAAEEVRSCLAEGMRLVDVARDPPTVLLGLTVQMYAMPMTGDLAGAAAAATVGLPLAQALRDDRWLGRFAAYAGMVAHMSGQADRGLDLAEQGLAATLRSKDRRAMILLYLLLAGQPEQERAAPLLRQLPSLDRLLVAAREVDRSYEPHLLRFAAAVALREGRLVEAARQCAACLRRLRTDPWWHELPYGLLVLARVATALGDEEMTLRLHGMARAKLPVLRRAAPPAWFEAYQSEISQIRERVGEERYAELTAQGEHDFAADPVSLPLAYAESVVESDGRSDGLPGDRSPADQRRGETATGPGVPRQSPSPEPTLLTPREQQVLAELVTGASNREISERLGLSVKTVMHHSVAIYRKLGVRGRAEATAWAFRHGMVR